MSKNSSLKKKLHAIFSRYMRGKATDSEQEFVDKFYHNLSHYESKVDIDPEVGQVLKKQINNQLDASSTYSLPRFTVFIRTVAAIFIAMLVCGGIYFLGDRDDAVVLVKKQGEASADGTGLHIVKDGASYNLADALPEGISVEQRDEQKVVVVSAATLTVTNKPLHLKNPNREALAIQLSDGTQLWLNQSAEVVVDPDFGQGDRIVQAEGEVYFKVKSLWRNGKTVPFMVHTTLQQIQVLGTSFLVDAKLKDKQEVVLIEGKVKLQHQKFASSTVLQPGQRAAVSKGDSHISVSAASQLHKIEAWRNGLFSFEEEGLADVMAELAQWYGVSITVSPAVQNQKYSGIITRYKDINEVFRLIELTKNIRLVEKGGKTYVMPVDKP